MPVAYPHHDCRRPVGPRCLGLRGDLLLHEPLEIGVDGELEGAAVGGWLGGHLAAGQHDPVFALLVGGGALGAGKALVVAELKARLWAVRAVEANEVSGDRTVRVGAAWVQLGVHPRHVQLDHGVTHVERDRLGNVGEVGVGLGVERGRDRLRRLTGRRSKIGDLRSDVERMLLSRA